MFVITVNLLLIFPTDIRLLHSEIYVQITIILETYMYSFLRYDQKDLIRMIDS